MGAGDSVVIKGFQTLESRQDDDQLLRAPDPRGVPGTLHHRRPDESAHAMPKHEKRDTWVSCWHCPDCLGIVNKILEILYEHRFPL